MRRRVSFAVLALTASVIGPATSFAQEYPENDACDVWQPGANPGPEFDPATTGPKFDPATPGPELNPATPGREFSPENGACGAYDDDSSDNQPVNGPLENLLSPFGL